MKNITMRGNSGMSCLLPELAMNILSRLPAKTLGQSKCVCKSWLSLISDPQFVQLHLIQASTYTKNNQPKLFMMYPFYFVDYESPSSILEDEEDHHDGNDAVCDAFLDLGFPYNDEEYCDDLVGSCNGLVCVLYCPDTFILWNPTTKETKKVYSTLSLSSDDILVYGFSYVSSMDDYRLLIGIPSPTGNEHNLFEIFSLKDNTWRKLQEELPNSVTIPEKMGLLASGALHWEAARGGADKQQFVFVSFDLLRGKFGEILQPEIVDKTIDTRTIGVLEGCLTCVSYSNKEMIIWVMKEYGVRDSWTKFAVIGHMDIMFCCYLKTVCVTNKEGEIIVDLDGERMLRYNLQEKTWKELKDRCWQYYKWTICVESLVSPNT